MNSDASGETRLRDATPQDVVALEAVMLTTEGRGPDHVGTQQAYIHHLVECGVVAVADAGGDVVGFGAAVDTGRARHLADLHVLPDWQGRGIGGRLLATVLADAWPRTTFASDDPRALPLYVRAGMDALWPNLYVAGNPALLAVPDGYAVEPVAFERMAELEAAWAGVDRGPHLAYWAATAGASAFVVAVGGRPVATGFGRRRVFGAGRWMGHAVVSPDADPGPALIAAVASEVEHGDLTGACVPGPSPVLRPLLEAGFRIVDRDTFLTSDAGLVDAHRELVNTGFL